VPSLCPCQSGLAYAACCQPLHQGAPAASAEALMRSRFSAFKLQLSNYLLASWHSETRPSTLSLDDTEWGRLAIHHSDNPHQVHFSAYFKENGQWFVQSEVSSFRHENGHWFYHSGDPVLTPWAPKRNEPCPCGAAKKFKQCCLKK